MHTKGGFTLVEVLIGIAIFGILLGIITSTYTFTLFGYQRIETLLEMQQNLRSALYYLNREIRMAGFNGENPVNRYGAGIVHADSESLTISFLAVDDGIDNNGNDSVDEPGELTTISYALYDAYGDGDMDLGRTPDNKLNIKRAIAENIDRVEFLYTLNDFSETLLPNEQKLNSIRMARITLLSRSEKKRRGGPKKIVYETPGGQLWEFNDSYYRKMMTTSVVCRNMIKN